MPLCPPGVPALPAQADPVLWAPLGASCPWWALAACFSCFAHCQGCCPRSLEPSGGVVPGQGLGLGPWFLSLVEWTRSQHPADPFLACPHGCPRWRGEGQWAVCRAQALAVAPSPRCPGAAVCWAAGGRAVSSCVLRFPGVTGRGQWGQRETFLSNLVAKFSYTFPFCKGAGQCCHLLPMASRVAEAWPCPATVATSLFPS